MPKLKVNYLGVLPPIVSQNGEYVELGDFATLGDLLETLGLRYGDRFRYSLQHLDGTLISGDVAIIVDGLPVHNIDYPLTGKQEIDIALIPMIAGG